MDRNSPARPKQANMSKVALRKESVDRNGGITVQSGRGYTSLSARRAWIEIVLGYKDTVNALSRSPQGERG